MPESLLFAYALNTISACSGSIMMNHVTDTFNYCLKFEMHFFIKFSHVRKLGEIGQLNPVTKKLNGIIPILTGNVSKKKVNIFHEWQELHV